MFSSASRSSCWHPTNRWPPRHRLCTAPAGFAHQRVSSACQRPKRGAQHSQLVNDLVMPGLDKCVRVGGRKPGVVQALDRLSAAGYQHGSAAVSIGRGQQPLAVGAGMCTEPASLRKVDGFAALLQMQAMAAGRCSRSTQARSSSPAQQGARLYAWGQSGSPRLHSPQ